MVKRSPLDDPRNADFAWARYFRILRAMGWVTLGVIVVACAWLYYALGPDSVYVSIHLYIATALGIGFTMMLMAALMGLVFLSSGTGHDESIEDPFDDGDWPS